MGKKWTNETKILFQKKKDLGISKLTIANCKQYSKNPYHLVFDGKHVAFFPSWNDAFDAIDQVVEKGIEIVRNKNKRVLKELKCLNGDFLCYRCEEYKPESSFKWGHKYCTDCALEQKKDYYYLNKYNLNLNRYSSFEKYFQSLMNKRNRKDYFSINDLMSVLEKQNYKCAITGQDFELKNGSPKLPSIDRIKPKKNGGTYELDNIQIIWHSINMFKSIWNMSFLLECSKHIINNNS
jgi:hypothetical protein